MFSDRQPSRISFAIGSPVICFAIMLFVCGCSTNPFKDKLFKSEFPSNEKESSVEWLESYKDAMDQAQSSSKPVLIDFTGTDWCVWCERLSEEVFDKATFQTWAEENVVLLKLDFPRSGNQSATLKRQNEGLAKKFEINSYPTVLFLAPDGSELGRTGYVKGGPSSFIKTAERIIKSDAVTP